MFALAFRFLPAALGLCIFGYGLLFLACFFAEVTS